MSKLSVSHLLGIKYLTTSDIELIFETASHFKEVINRPIKKVPSLRDVTIANLFLKIVHELNCPLNWPKNDSQPTSLISPLQTHLSKKESPSLTQLIIFYP